MPNTIAEVGRSLWLRKNAERVRFLIDGENYFESLIACLSKARRRIYILGWDFDTRVKLRPSSGNEPEVRLGPLLEQRLADCPELEIFVLSWDFNLVYTFERELITSRKLSLLSHNRVHFHMDDRHPIGASQHQKIVVVDDDIAFIGGFDLCDHRWDTSNHRPKDPRRTTIRGECYGPFHDVQVLLQGPVAQSLAEIFCWRWKEATGKELEQPSESVGPSQWPQECSIDFEQIEVGVARTIPPFAGHKGVYEIRHLFLDAVDRAQDYIYIENQYFTSKAFAAALIRSLQKSEGPQIFLVLPEHASGWFEQSTMGALRSHILRQVRKKDRYGRLHIYYPFISRQDVPLEVHSKIMIVDDKFVHVGSANLSNRSLGLDSECDIVVEGDDDHIRHGTRDFLHRLLSEHLNVTPDQFSEKREQLGLIAAVQDFRGSGRSLRPFSRKELASYPFAPDPEWVDPERPMRLHQSLRGSFYRQGVFNGKLGLGLLLLVMGLMLWRWEPLRGYFSLEKWSEVAEFLRNTDGAALIVFSLFIFGNVILFPVTLILLFTALVYEPIDALVLCFAGALLGALATYGAGRIMGTSVLRKIPFPRLRRAGRLLRNANLMTLVVVRMLPTLPYGAVNFVAGVVNLKLGVFVAGTVLGLAPGIFALTLVADRVRELVRSPSYLNVLWLTVALLISLLAFRAVKRRLQEHYA